MYTDITDNTGYGVIEVGGKDHPLRGSGSLVVTNASDIDLKLFSQPLASLPVHFALHQNYPNPFNPTTSISFDIPNSSLVTLKVYNILGQEVATLLDHIQYDQGSYQSQFNANNFASGVYFYRITAQTVNGQGKDNSFTDVKRMLLIK